MHIVFRQVLVLALVLVAVGVGAAESLHFWNGDRRQDISLSADRIVLVNPVTGTWDVQEADLTQGTLEERLAATKGYAVARLDGQTLYLTDRFSLAPKPGQDLDALCRAHGLRVVEAVPYLPGAWIVAAKDPLTAIAAANALYEGGLATFATPLAYRQREARLTPNDTLFNQQWHLPLIQAAAAWDLATGDGVNIAIVDDGVQHSHEDLSDNARTDIDIDLNGGDNDPAPDPAEDHHGTFVAGCAAGVGTNNLGIVGVAFEAGVVGVRLIAAPSTDAQEAQALSHRLTGAAADQVHVSNNSWGPSDDGATLDGPGPLLAAALQTGVTSGRDGKGVIYVIAGGNGHASDDNASYDGFAGRRNTIGVAAVTSTETRASYSELGCNLLVCAPGGSGTGMVSTDIMGANGYAAGNYTGTGDSIQGTSFSAPVVAGVVALLLEENPDLTWREVMQVLVRTAKQNDPGNAGWITNHGGASGLHFNHAYGFGLVQAADALAAVDPTTWKPLPASATPLTASDSPGMTIPDNNATGIQRTVTITAPARFRAEHVELTVSATHTYRGDLSFELTSPQGTRAVIADRPGDANDHFSAWTFTSVVTWGEEVGGVWTLKVADNEALDQGTLSSWSLRIHGYIAAPPPTLTSHSHPYILTGSGDTVITLTGSGFEIDSEATFNDAPVATTFVSTTTLQATIPAAGLASDGTHQVAVVNHGFMGEGGGTSGDIDLITSGPFAPIVLTDPSDAVVFAGRPATFSASVVGLPPPTLAWERSDPPAGAWTAVPLATSASHITAPTVIALDNGARYRLVATNSQGSATSAEALLSVLPGLQSAADASDDCGGGLGIGCLLLILGLGLRRRR